MVLLVLLKTAEHFLGKALNPNYAGVSTAGDYEYIVSSLGYAGYDSLITEKNWQEFMAYEYAVLMDVAEYIWEGQNEWNETNPDGYKDTVLGPYPAEYYAQNKGKDYDHESVETEEIEGVKEGNSTGIKGTGPAYLPYLPVTQDYNSAALTKEDWNKLVIAGQGSARFGIQNEAELGNEEFAKDSIIYGGNRDVMPPTLTYEYKTNPNEPDGPGSLVPYISVLKEELQYFYFTVGNREEFEGTVDAHSGGVVINEGNIDKVDLMEISQLLNVGNPYIKQSTVWAQWWDNNMDIDPRYTKEAWPIADETFEQNLYFTNMYSSVVYKTALQVMIDRYLPKASLLTSWYYLKDTDLASSETQGKEDVVNLSGTTSNFDLDKLMRDVKEIYNYYCWEEPGESTESQTVESVTYDPQDGSVIRDESTGEAIMSQATLEVATTNNDTFIHFGQAGIESNRFDVFKTYEPHGLHAAIPKPEAPTEITGDEEELTIPVITELLSEDAQFMDRFGFKVTFDYTYQYSYEEKVLVGYTPGGSTGGATVTVTVSSGHIGHVWGSTGGSFGVCGNITCSQCAGSYGSYTGYTVQSKRADTNPRSETYVLKEPGSSSGGTGGGTGGSTGGQPIYDWVPRTAEASDTANIVIPYEATNNVEPRGGDGCWEMDEISQFVHDQIVLRAEEKIMDEIAALRLSSDFEIETQEEEFVNHGYWYPITTYKDGEDLKADVLTFFDERYRRSLGFYNFKAVSGDGAPTEEELKNLFKNNINEIFMNLRSYTEAPKDPFTGKEMTAARSVDEFKQLIKAYLEALYVGTGKVPVPPPDIPIPPVEHRNLKFDYVTSIDNIHEPIGGIAENVPTDQYEITNFILKGGTLMTTAVGPEFYNKTFSFENNFTKVSEQTSPYDAIYDIDDYVLALNLAIPQKRIATMIVTDVEAWAKSAKYDIQIVNNTFDYTNYRYVVPHSYFNFGVRLFNIDEKPSYRTEYYKEYFSKIDAERAGIKEADVLTMMLKWEEFANSGNDTAYAYMRDLYKLIIYIREKYDGGQILSTAYSYLYVPDTIWEFREGISQEAFWTERLAADMPGKPDALTDEELDKVLVKKEEIAWQVLDYDEYEECQYIVGGETKARVYALFPHGASYVRTWFQEQALNGGRFDDGGFVEGHESADWLSRSDVLKQLENGNDPYGIVDYEIKTRAARKILGDNGGLADRASRAESVLNGSTSDNIYIETKEEVMAEIKEYAVKSPIVSIAAGTVYKANYDCYSGFAVGVNHENENASSSAQTSYVHMRRWPSVQLGDVVGPGTVVGYEGTTGNSSGYHLHQNLWVNGVKSSPAAYMGPIFTPFYNKEKILETVGEIEGEWNASRKLILGTEYMDLYRTVLKYPLDSDPNLQTYLFEGGALDAGGVTFLMQCSFMEIDGREYINYQTGSKNGIPMYYSGKNSVVVKVGASPSRYYLCNVSEEVVTEEIDEDGNTTQTKYLRVNSKREIQFNESSLAGGVKIRVRIGVDEVTDIIWGNNVTLYPLFEDMADLVDITVLNTERMLNPDEAKYASEYAGDANDPVKKSETKDVTAREEFFTPDEERLKIPEWILSYLSDVDSPFAVPFYEGPISVTMQGQVGTSAREIGYAGTASGDVLAFEKALKMKGYAPGDALDLKGEYNDKLVAVMQSAVSKIDDGYVTMYFEDGVLGETPDAGNHMVDFGHQGICYWNAYVTYGSVTASQVVGREACRQGATVAGLRPSFVLSVGAHESSHIPTVDSFLFCSERQKFNFYTDEKDDGFITYRGVDKVLRRAIGLMQIAPPGAVSMAMEKTNGSLEQALRYLRNPRTNAVLGSEILVNMMNMIRRNENGWNDMLKANINGNSAFDRMQKDSGIDKYEIGLMGCAALMYNMGPNNGNTEKVINAMTSVQYDGTTVTCTDGYANTGYWIDVMNEVVADGRAVLSQDT